jgi:PAS domain S-box-containing protein
VELEEQAALLHLAHDSIIVCDLNARIVFWSRGAEQNYGWSRNEALGKIAHEFLHTRFPENREQIMSELLRNGSWEGELIHTRSSGSTMTVASRWALQRDRHGLPKRIMEINNDISERKRAEEHLRQSEERYRDLFEHAAELIQNVGPRGNLLFVNPAWKATLGYGDEDFSSLTMLEILAPEARDAWNGIAARALNGETIDQVESRFLTRDGRSVHVAGRVTCRRDEKGEVAYTSAILRDVTKAKEVAQLKDEFVSIVSHELRTPLTSIRGSLGLLASGMMQSLPEKGQRMLTIALNNTERLVRLINDILDLERIQSGKVPMHKSLSDAEALMRQSVEVVQATAEKANVVVALDAVSIPLMVDPDRIVQTFTNLLSNAIKFSQPGAMVHFSVRQKGTNAVFKVQDTGRGIPVGKLDLVFERFQQVDASDARVKGGTGLGLSICRKIVEQHDGTIWVESAFGLGSSFYISLPAAASANMTAVDARPAKSRPPRLSGSAYR